MGAVSLREVLQLSDLLIMILLLLLVLNLEQLQVVRSDLDGVINISILLLHCQYLFLLMVSEFYELALIVLFKLCFLILYLLLLIEDLLLRIGLLFSVALLEGALEALLGLDVILLDLLLRVVGADEIVGVLRQAFLCQGLVTEALSVIRVDVRGTQLLLDLVPPVRLERVPE